MHEIEEQGMVKEHIGGALDLLSMHETQCAKVIEQHRTEIQDFRVMKDYAYSCEQVFSDERWCLIGEAAVSLDPLYSPGGDLINHALDGEDIEDRAAIHNQVNSSQR